MKNTAILLISCPDAKGEVATIADFVYRHGGNILHADEHGDLESGLFLMRVEFDPRDFDIDLSQKGLADFSRYFSPVAETFHMQWRLALSSHRPRMIVFVSKFGHCLVDLLYRQQSGELACDIPLIISNHPDHQPVADFYKIPYAVVPITKENKTRPKPQSGPWLTSTGRTSWFWPATCRFFPSSLSNATPIASSTFTTLFCRRLLAPAPTIRPLSVE